MKVIEPLILFCWLLVIFIYQFHQDSNEKLKAYDLFSLLPSFHLFSPRPFMGKYVISYKIFDHNDVKTVKYSGEINYMETCDFLDANKRVIKCINNLCKRFPKRKSSSNNLMLLEHYIKSQIENRGLGDKLQFSVIVKTGKSERIKFNSKIYDL